MKGKFKKIGMLLSLAVFLVVPNVWADRASLNNPQQQINCIPSETWAFRIEDDRTPNGTLNFGVNCDGSFEKGVVNKVTSPTWTAAAGFTITPSDGNVWLIDLSVNSTSAADGDILYVMGGDVTGTTVSLPTTITEAMDGQPMTFIVANSVESGTSLMVLYAGAGLGSTSGVSILHVTGVTNA